MQPLAQQPGNLDSEEGRARMACVEIDYCDQISQLIEQINILRVI